MGSGREDGGYEAEKDSYFAGMACRGEDPELEVHSLNMYSGSCVSGIHELLKMTIVVGNRVSESVVAGFFGRYVFWRPFVIADNFKLDYFPVCGL